MLPTGFHGSLLVSMSCGKWVGLPEYVGEGAAGRSWLSSLHAPSQPVGVVANAVFCPLLGSCPPAHFVPPPLGCRLEVHIRNKVEAEPTGPSGPEGPPPQITDLKGGSRRVIRGNTSLGPRSLQLALVPSSSGHRVAGEGPSRGNPSG